MTERAIKMKITRNGMRALFASDNAGVQMQLSHIAIGTGGGTGYVPVGNETALRSEFERVPIAGGEYLGPFEILAEGNFAGAASGWINEIGIFATPENPADPPVLFALWSEVQAALTYKSANVPVVIGATISLSEIPPNSLTLSVGAPSVNITIAGPFAQLSAEIIRLQRRAVESENARLIPVINTTWP